MGPGITTTPAEPGGGRPVAHQDADQPPIRNTLLPHFGHVPEIAGLPFFIVMFFGFLISTFILSLTQYASATGFLLVSVVRHESPCPVSAVERLQNEGRQRSAPASRF